MKNCRDAGLGDRLDEPSELRRQSVFDVDGIGLRASPDINAKQCVQ